MSYFSQINPISCLKANAAEVLLQLAEHQQPMVITQNGEARAVIQDIASFEATQETLALQKHEVLLTVGRKKTLMKFSITSLNSIRPGMQTMCWISC